MQNKGLLFIPDISGFTRFVNTMEIEHSRAIIQELLEILVNSNHIGLQISEIEGDAILFYKFGDPPDLMALYSQVEKMFCEFHKNLVDYESRRYCQCRGCTSAINLTLKVITHYGEFTDYQVREFKKLIGKDIIVAHQLLKNDIDQHEYWLVSKQLVEHTPPVDLQQWLQWESSIKQTETGPVPFHYTQLGELKKDVKPESFPFPGLPVNTKMVSVSMEYNMDIIRLFHATGDFSLRNRWWEGVERVEELDHLLPRVGMRCRCVFHHGFALIYSSSYAYRDDRIEFSETNESDHTITRYLLQKSGEQLTKLTLELYMTNNTVRRFLFKWMKRKRLEADMLKSLLNLNRFVSDPVVASEL
jgi:hypothetical protein